MDAQASHASKSRRHRPLRGQLPLSPLRRQPTWTASIACWKQASGLVVGGLVGASLFGIVGCAQHARLREGATLPALAENSVRASSPMAADALTSRPAVAVEDTLERHGRFMAASQSGASQSGASQSGASRSGASRSGASQSGAAESRAAESRAAESSASESAGFAEPNSDRFAEELATASIPVSLVAVLEAVDRDNPLVNAARHRVEEAYASWSRAEALWLPSLRAGGNYNKHDGRIQDVVGGNIATNRNAVYGGLGASAVGAGSPAIPGVYANVHTADAWFQPKIASQTAAARRAGADSAANAVLLEAALAYCELLRAEQERAAWRELTAQAERLVKLTESYSKTGQGLAADFDRAATELALRRNEALRAAEASRVASARLAQLMRLDPTLSLEPLEPGLAALHLVSPDEPASHLIATALMSRPEVRENQALVAEAVGRLQRERWAPLMPSVLLGVSQGGFGAGLNGDFEHFGGRLDADVAAWWEVRNLGLGERAARNESQARLQQARWREVAVMDQIAREVVEARTRVVSRREQLEIARQAVEVAEASRRKNLDRIENGEGLPLECLQSLQALAQAQREHIRVIADYNAAQFSLLWAVGSVREAASER